MAGRWLRAIRFTALALSCSLAGLLAGQWFWSEREPPAPPPEPARALVEQLPDFSLPDLQGQPRSVRDWSDRSLLINFWATWCAPCRAEMPLLQALQDARDPQEFTVLGIAVDREPAVSKFLTETGISYPNLIGQQAAMDAAETFGPEFVGLPFTVLVAPGGAVLGLHAGEIDAAELDDLAELLDAVAAKRMTVADARRQMAGNPPGVNR